jgi:hypothetical protein
MVLSVVGLLVLAVLAVMAMTVLYCVIRFAVRDGMIDAERKRDADRVRAELGLGRERSPNSRRRADQST